MKGEPEMTHTAFIVAALALCVATVSAQTPAAQNPISGGQKFLHAMAKNNIIRAAEKMPEDNYSFKPTPEVRSFAQLIGHIADAQYLFCSAVLGKPNPAPGIEKSKTTKADLVQALKDAFAYSDQAYDGMTDAQAGALVKLFGADQAKVTVLAFNTAHNNEHYGNIVTYLRMKGLLPPPSERR
jgi:uncharacterized damage-inducible protein DinB